MWKESCLRRDFRTSISSRRKRHSTEICSHDSTVWCICRTTCTPHGTDLSTVNYKSLNRRPNCHGLLWRWCRSVGRQVWQNLSTTVIVLAPRAVIRELLEVGQLTAIACRRIAVMVRRRRRALHWLACKLLVEVACVRVGSYLRLEWRCDLGVRK